MGLDLGAIKERVRTPEAQDSFKRWFDAAPLHSGPVVANQLGWQVSRSLAKNGFVRARGLLRRPPVPAAFARALDQDGIVAIPDYLAPADHERVLDALDGYVCSPHLRDIGSENGSGLTYWSGHVVSDEPEDSGMVLIGTFAADSLIVSLAEHVIHRHVRPPLTLVFQSLEVPEGGRDDRDREQLLHADKFFSCAKAIYFPDAVTEGSSPFVYCPGSHRLTAERLRYEYAMSVREAQLRAGQVARYDDFDAIGFERSRNVVGPAFRSSLALREQPITCAPNTLVVVNNRGFHRRGELAAGERRRSLWVNFYPYQRPVYGRAAFWAAKRVVDTDDVPRTLPAMHRQQI